MHIIKHVLECVLSNEAIDTESKIIAIIRKSEHWTIASYLKSLCLNKHALFQKAEVAGIKFIGLLISTNEIYES